MSAKNLLPMPLSKVFKLNATVHGVNTESFVFGVRVERSYCKTSNTTLNTLPLFSLLVDEFSISLFCGRLQVETTCLFELKSINPSVKANRKQPKLIQANQSAKKTHLELKLDFSTCNLQNIPTRFIVKGCLVFVSLGGYHYLISSIYQLVA